MAKLGSPNWLCELLTAHVRLRRMHWSTATIIIIISAVLRGLATPSKMFLASPS